MLKKLVLSGIAALLLFSSLIGCHTVTSYMNYSELKEYKTEMHIENNFLFIKLENPTYLTIAKINHKYTNGNLYLGAIRISTGGGRISEFRIILPENTTDMAKRIYWVNTDGSAHLLYPEYLK